MSMVLKEYQDEQCQFLGEKKRKIRAKKFANFLDPINLTQTPIFACATCEF